MRPASAWTWLPAAGAAAAATGACLLLDGRMSPAGLAMVYLVASLACAVRFGLGAGIAASLLSVSALNFFFVPPRYTFEVDGVEYWWTLAVLLAAAVAASTLVGRLRREREAAVQGQSRAARLHELSQVLLAGGEHGDMAAAAARWMQQTLGHACCVWTLQDGSLVPHGAPADAAFHEPSARWALEHGRPLGRGCHDWPDLSLWCAPFAGAGSAGAVQLLLGARDQPDDAQLQHWLDLARQAGFAIDRARAADEARRAAEAAHAESARNTLLASLSHDLRTPLTAIVGTASTLRTQGEQLGAAQRERLAATLESEATDLVAMADNVLQVARLSQPQAQLRLQWESLDDVVAAAAQRVRRRWPSARLQLKIARELPPIRAEAALLVQCLVNLAENAVRHGGEAPQIVLTAGRSREGVFIAVRDHGAGLPAGELADLFERYTRGDRESAGAGLGLAICRLVAQAHGGAISARRCEPGAEFRIDLPAAAARETADA